MAKLIRQIARIAAVVAVTAAPAAPLMAQQSPKAPSPKDTLTEQTERAVKEGIEAILRTLDRMINSVPLYEMPEVLENGDIIIRRKPPDAPRKDEKKDKDGGKDRDSSST